MIWASFLQSKIGVLKIINIGALGDVVVNEKDISFHQKPEALLPEVLESLQRLDEVKGFLDPREGVGLYEVALEASKMGPCLEIGSYCGKSTIYIGTACKKNNGILFSIDHHRGSEEQQSGEAYFDPELFDPETCRVDTFKEFRKTIELAELEDIVVPIVCRSEVAARLWATPLSLVFIDGGHTYEAACTDYNAWTGHIMSSGYLLIHDIFKDPEKGGQAPYHIYKLAVASGLFKELPMIDTLGVLQRYGCEDALSDVTSRNL